ncbi:hypothetical protein E4U57_000421 [Claviceps arundinis]|uniref:Uncharacterized protein n=1 Tax=Claviceps arundinis TaxID=1623583 RepID=A0ABQ7PLU1_9HYPO|nr:hypothetical protein E4U57_000421 [Claviceps arundinis]
MSQFSNVEGAIGKSPATRYSRNSPSKSNYDSENGIGEPDNQKMTNPSSSTVYDAFAGCISDKASLVDVWEKKFYPALAKAVFELNSMARADERKKANQLTADNITDAVKDAVAEVLNTSKDAVY